jgi:hypothetical protein
MKKVVLIVVMVLSACSVFAQDNETEKKGFQKDKLFIGGNFGLSFGTYTLVNISPQLGYRFNRHLAAGFGTNFQFAQQKEKYNGQLYRKVSQGLAGLNIFGRYYPFEQFMIQVQPEANYIFGKQKFYDVSPPEVFKLDAEIIPSLLVGGGIVIPSGRGSFILYALYDLIQNINSPYGKKPFLNIGYNVSL